MVYGGLVALMHPALLGPAYPVLSAPAQLLARPFGQLLGLGPYPIQADVIFRVLASILGALIWMSRKRSSHDESTLFQLLQLEYRVVVGAALVSIGLGHALGV